MSPARAVLSVLVAIATMLVITGIAVGLFLNPWWVAFEQGRTGAAELTGYTPDQVRVATDSILHDLVIGPPDFAQAVSGRPVFDERERAHMQDVRGVFVAFGGLVLLAALLLVNARLASRGQGWFRRAMGWGAAVLGVAVVAGGIVAAFAFDQAFEVFHELFFPGGSYTFDPATERLVQLFPIAFWEETTIAVGVVILLISAVVAWWGLIRRPAAATPSQAAAATPSGTSPA
jgi:integral membrane protein (TIGR01906 family)